MTSEDLQYIFKTQLDQAQTSDTKLFYMLVDRGYKMIDRHPASDLDGLVDMLSAFEYAGNEGGMPRFAK